MRASPTLGFGDRGGGRLPHGEKSAVGAGCSRAQQRGKTHTLETMSYGDAEREKAGRGQGQWKD